MKNTFQRSGRLLAFGCIFSALLLTSCTEETLETSSPDLPESQDLTIALVPDPSEPILIDDLIPTELKTTQAAGDDRGRRRGMQKT